MKFSNENYKSVAFLILDRHFQISPDHLQIHFQNTKILKIDKNIAKFIFYIFNLRQQNRI